MNPKSAQPPDRGPLSEADERVIDAMVGEILEQTPSPPDLSESILHQLRALQVAQSGEFEKDASQIKDTYRRSESKVRNGGSPRHGRWSGWAMAASALVLAASILLFVTQSSIFLDSGIVAVSKVNDAKLPSSDLAAKAVKPGQENTETKSDSRPGSEQVKGTGDIVRTPPRQGVPMVRQESPANALVESRPNAPAVKEIVKSNVSGQSEVSLVRFNETLEKYWQNVGVKPASELSDEALAERIERRFGFKPTVSREQLLVGVAFDSPEACGELAKRLIDRLFRDVPLAEGVREKMVTEATASIAGGEGFDRLVAGWLGNEKLFDRSIPQRLSQSLATNFLDADAACAQCHDSPVDGRLGQHDYWAFASAFAPTDRASLFYELNDGRQKIAESRLPDRWFAESDWEHLKNFKDDKSTASSLQKQFADSLIGSHTLAGAIANRLWEIGFDNALVPRASAPIAPPRDDSLQQAQAELAGLLLSNRFDVRAAARTVIASVAMRRGQSELTESGRWQMADEGSIVADALLVRSFAAAPMSAGRVGRDQLLSMMASRIGNLPKDLSGTDALLAQPMIVNVTEPNGAEIRRKPSIEEQLWASWIADRPLFRDSWLHWIKDNDEQRRHVYYAVGLTAPRDDASIIERLKSPGDEPEVSDSAANDRLLWVLMQSR